jgi:Fe-S-cluster containining protein
MEAGVRVPLGPVSLPELLPVLHAFANALVSVAETRARESGKQISCRAGCGACCRQLVPISEAEARYLVDYLASLPEARRAALEARFEQALARLDTAGLLERLKDVPAETAEREALALQYFHLGIPCPFLEQESCGIYAWRPMICREYLVSSPAAACASPSPEAIERVHTVARGSQVLYKMVQGAPRYLPLVLLFDWVRTHPDAVYPLAPGPQLFRYFLGEIQRQIKEK